MHIRDNAINRVLKDKESQVVMGSKDSGQGEVVVSWKPGDGHFGSIQAYTVGLSDYQCLSVRTLLHGVRQELQQQVPQPPTSPNRPIMTDVTTF